MIAKTKGQAQRSGCVRRGCMLVLLGMIALIAVGAAWSLFGPEPEPTRFEITRPQSDSLKFVGDFDQHSAASLLSALERAPEIRSLILTSGGGDVKAAIRVATLVHDRKLTVVVDDYCMSSCFNYFIPAARLVEVRAGALLGFHGTAYTTAKTAPGFLRSIVTFAFRNDIAAEAAFWKKVGRNADDFMQVEYQRSRYNHEHNIEDTNFWMIGRDVFERHGFMLSPGSYFPRSQTELDKMAKRVTVNHDSFFGKSETRTELKMSGSF